ncbi:Uncharacterized protein HZ326_14995 [Fusarium oxysporum f. sp. albedinis]|nr:Uncharacterized protein HZ326_14995 [Fusarium oxysporum f. sp. albedinis]
MNSTPFVMSLVVTRDWKLSQRWVVIRGPPLTLYTHFNVHQPSFLHQDWRKQPFLLSRLFLLNFILLYNGLPCNILSRKYLRWVGRLIMVDILMSHQLPCGAGGHQGLMMFHP